MKNTMTNTVKGNVKGEREMNHNEVLNNVLRTMFVAKINLPEVLPQKLVDLELVPNTNDCFLVSKSTVKRMEVLFRIPGQKDLWRMEPASGSKMIGSFRDKGSVTEVMDRYVPFVEYVCNNKVEADRLVEALKQMRDGEDTFYIQQNNIVCFQIDIIANPSTGRDNVSALVLQSCLELEGILEDKPQEYTLKEIAQMNVIEVVKRRKHEHRVFMYDTVGKKVVYDFGTVPVMLEDFFWQPKHDNSLHCKEKEMSCTYSQFKDGIELLMPTLYKCLNKSLDYESIHEHCICLGMEFRENNYSNEILEAREEKYSNVATEDDL